MLCIFVLSVVCANLFASKELFTFRYLALDCGFAFSWIMFLCMDLICKRFGAKASVELSLFALLVNLCVCIIFYLLARTPGNWSAYYLNENPEVNSALNSTMGSTWKVVFGSATAFTVSSIVNALLNQAIGRMWKKTSLTEFATRSFVSTFIGQFTDNFVFASLVSRSFFGWTIFQILSCSVVAAFAELMGEVIFALPAYKTVIQWEKELIGHEYLDRIKEREK